MKKNSLKLMISFLIFSFIIVSSLSCISANENVTDFSKEDISNNDNIGIVEDVNTTILGISDNNKDSIQSISNEKYNNTNTNNLENNQVNNILSDNSNAILTADNLTKYYGYNDSFITKLTDNDGNVLNNQNISINLANSYGKNITYTCLTNDSGEASLSINLGPGLYYVTSSYQNITINNIIKVLSGNYLNANDFYETYGEGLNFTGTLKDSDGNPLIGMHISLNLTRLSDNQSKVYWATTDIYGEYSLQINLYPGDYTTESSFYGFNNTKYSYPAADSIINSMIVYSLNETTNGNYVSLNSILTTASFLKNYIVVNGTLPSTINLNNKNFSIAQFLDLMTKAIIEINNGSKEDIEITNVSNAKNCNIESLTGTLSKDDIVSMASRIESYIIKNNRAANYDSSNGIGKISYENYVNIFAETLSYYNQNNVLPSSIAVNTNIMKKGGVTEVIKTSSGSYTLTTLLWGTGGDLTKNSVLMNNIESTSLTTQVLDASKNGTVLLTFGNGNGKTVFINAGVHGNELSSIAATFKLINILANLDQSKINGTIYVVCDLCPASAATSTRYFNGVNLNSVANVDGTVSNNLIKIAKSLGTNIFGDFHCTQPGGNPGANTVFGTYKPTSESATIASYIASKCSVSKIIYSYAGSEYEGAVEDVCNLNSIPAVTCEVLTSHGTIASGTVNKSFNMMNALLNYAGINI